MTGVPVTAQDVLVALDLLLKKGLRLYRADHAIVEGYRRKLYQKMQALVAAKGTMALAVTSKRILVDGEQVYCDEDVVPENFVLRLFRDGIREITFLPGVSAKDLDAFCNALGSNPNLLSFMGEDLVTLLFNANLSTVKYFAIPTVLPASKERRVSPAEVLALAGLTLPPRPRLSSLGVATVKPRSTLEFLTPLEERDLRGRIEGDGGQRIATLSMIFLDILLSPDLAREAEAVRGLLPGLFESVLSYGVYDVPLKAIGRLEEMAPRDRGAADELSRLIDLLSRSQALHTAVEAYAEGRTAGAEDLLMLVSHLGVEALPAILRLLAATKDPLLATPLRSFAVKLGKRSVDTLVKLVKAEKESQHDGIQELAIDILARLRTARSRKALVALARQGAESLRLQAIDAMMDQYEPRLEPVVVELMDDEREIVRVSAREAFLRIARVAALEALRSVALRHLGGREPTVRGREAAREFAAASTDESVPAFLDWLHDRSAPLALRLVSAEMLGQSLGKQARAALTREQKRWFQPKILKKACRVALCK